MPLLEVNNLRTYFHTRNGIVRAVDGISFSVDKGKTIGIVGESGSGKSVSCYSLLGLLPMPPGKIESGEAIFDKNTDLLSCGEKVLRTVRGKRIGMIFQDPMTSLNPYMRIADQIIEPLRLHMGMDKRSALEKAIHALDEVGIPEPDNRITMYPHEFSGGMRQRVMIAMALITNPEILIADEPTTALDVTIQKQILDLIKKRQKELGTAVIFITHDLAVISEICEDVNIMYAGRIVEKAGANELFANPRHAYTRSLLKSIPANQTKGEKLYTIPGLPPDTSQIIPGCAFRERNQIGDQNKCLTDSRPEFKEIEPNHWAQDCPGCLS
ncbi:MAG: ABC transporter ATP-binding protein [Verrucomicrobiales bacterium]|nr:ABC transporter ATP-binding protein [Verrucomicrobiales bacterium]